MTIESGPTVGAWLHELLKSYEVDTVFGIPGVHTIPMYAGLKESGIRHVTPRHEQGAGFMAEGYARVTGKPGVCFIITGPGMTNILTAMGQAFSESIPMLVISSVSRRDHLRQGRGFLHELPDQQAMASGVSAFSHTLHELADLPEVLARAFAIFESARPRPVHIEIPLDVWDQKPPKLSPQNVTPGPRGAVPHPDDLAEAAGLLRAASSPLLIAGGGARSAALEIRHLAEALNAPVLMTINARGILTSDHELRVSVSGSAAAVRRLIEESDLVFAIGSELGPTDFDIYDKGVWPKFRRLIRLDIESEQLSRNASPSLSLLGAAQPTLAALNAVLPIGDPGSSDGARRAETARNEGRRELSPRMEDAVRFLEEIRDAVPDARLVGDSTQPVYAGNLYFDAERPNSWFNSSVGFGTLGYALPAAVGAGLGDAERPVVCLVGDGGLHFTLGELSSLCESRANVTVVVWNNSAYGEIKSSMTDANVSPIGVDLHSPDFLSLAKAFGMQARHLTTKSGIGVLVRDAVQSEEPYLILVDDF